MGFQIQMKQRLQARNKTKQNTPSKQGVKDATAINGKKTEREILCFICNLVLLDQKREASLRHTAEK